MLVCICSSSFPCFMHTVQGVLTILPNQTVPAKSSGIIMRNWSKRPPQDMYLHSAELNVVAVTENVNTFLLV